MAHTNLESYYKTNFALVQHHKYSLTEIENMIPWERDVYISLLKQYIDEENLKWLENALLREMSSVIGNEKEKIKVSLYNDIEYLKASELILNNNEYAKYIKPKN